MYALYILHFLYLITKYHNNCYNNNNWYNHYNCYKYTTTYATTSTTATKYYNWCILIPKLLQLVYQGDQMAKLFNESVAIYNYENVHKA